MKRLLYLFFSLTITFLLIISVFQISVSATELSKNMRSVYGDFLYEVKNSSATITGYIGDKSSVVIPSKIDGVDVKNINPGAFQFCRNIKSVYIPNSITSIGYDAFWGCSNLADVTISNNIDEIGDDAFAGTEWYNNKPDGLVYIGNVAYKYKGKMTSNTDIIIKSGIESISDYAFSSCKYLQSIVISDGVKSIGFGAFKNCTNLADITVPESVTNIGFEAFSGTKWFENQSNGLVYIGKVAYKYKGDMPVNTVIDLRYDTNSISPYAFNDCENLLGINIYNNVISIGGSAFEGCSNLLNIDLPNSILSIGWSAFKDCTSLLKITIPNSVANIGQSAFKMCTSLSNIILSTGMTEINESTFEYCKNLSKITIPDGITSISKCAFYGCENLKSIVIPKTIQYIGKEAFDKCAVNFEIYGYKDTVAKVYAEENGFKFIALDISVPTSVSLNKTSLTLDVGKSYTLTKTVSPSNAVTSYTWSSSNTSVATVDGNGKVTAKASGTATITVKTSNGKTATCKVTVNLPAPQITGLSNTTGGIKISWNKVDGAYGYRVYHKTSNGWKRIKDTTATSYTDSAVSVNQTKTYTIRCIDKNGNTVSGFNSKGWSKKYTPVAPTISKLDITTGGIKLSWNKIAGVYGYRLYYKTSSGGWKRFKDTTATSFTDSGVSPNRTETYTIRCIDKNGNTVSGFNSKGWSKKYTPVAPTISKLENTSGGIKLSWNKIAGVYGYRLYYKTSSGGWKRFKDTTATSFTDSGVSPNRTETYTIRCIDKNGNTVSGYNSKGWSKKYAPVAPKITKLTNTSKGVSATWNKVAGVYGYRLYRKYAGGSWTKVKDTTAASYTDSGAKKGKKVTYTLRCIDKNGKTISGYNATGWSITRK